MCAQSGCNVSVCRMSDVFPMSPEGPQGTYCNSWGKIHDLITVTELYENLAVIFVGNPSKECCWFPGYNKTLFLLLVIRRYSLLITVIIDFSTDINGQ